MLTTIIYIGVGAIAYSLGYRQAISDEQKIKEIKDKHNI